MSIRILLADDHQIVRQGLRLFIRSQSDMELVAEAEDGRMAVELVREFSPDVVIMDIVMPELNGIEATRQIVAEFPDVRIIGLSAYCDKEHAVEMLKAGASGYLPKHCTFEELSLAIRTVAADRVYLDPGIASSVIEDYVYHLSSTADHSESSVLSGREREVLQLVAEGGTSREIASRLHISPKTVERHRQSIMDKLNTRSVAGLTKYAVRSGLTPLEE